MMRTADDAEARLVETFLDLVRIDSPSCFESAVARYCEIALLESGCTVWFDDSAPVTGSDIGNLIAELPGDAPGVLILSAHMDCVEPCRGVVPEVREGVVFSAGDTVLGADDKAGIAVAIECVRRLAESTEPRPTIRCVFTVQEEVGLNGAKALEDAVVEADLCLVLDADGSPGVIVTGAPTHYTFDARFRGRAAHAGVRPEDGISAIAMAAQAVTQLPIGRIDPITTANVGTISGGTATNVIAGQTVVTGECRSLDRQQVEDVRESMGAIMRRVAAEAGGAVDIEWTLEYEGFSLDDDDPRLGLLSAACVDAGLTPVFATTGGGSDANIIASRGVPTVVLSCGMRGVHGTDESIVVSDLESLTHLCLAVATRLATR